MVECTTRTGNGKSYEEKEYDEADKERKIYLVDGYIHISDSITYRYVTVPSLGVERWG